MWWHFVQCLFLSTKSTLCSTCGAVVLHPIFCDLICPWALQLCHNGCDGIPNHHPHDWLLNRLFRHRSKKTSKLCITGLYVGNSPVTSEFPAQRASNAENVSIWWRHYRDMEVIIQVYFSNSFYKLIFWAQFLWNWSLVSASEPLW